MDKVKIITLCGSSRFIGAMAVCAWFLERDEGVATMGLHLLPGWYSAEPITDHLAEHEGVKDHMDDLHFRKIEASDEIFVVDYGNYIGNSTTREIRYALSKGKSIRYFTLDPIGEKVRILISEALKRMEEIDYGR